MEIVVVIFLFSGIIQIIFFIAFLFIFSRKLKEKKHDCGFVSVVVCANNERKNLEKLVPALLAQDYSDFEIVIVDDRSVDGTSDYLDEVMCANSRIKIVSIRNNLSSISGKKYALTRGIQASAGEYILLIDADCCPYSRRWVRSMSEGFGAATQIVLGYSPYTRSEGFLNLFIRFETLLTGIQYMGMAYIGRPYMGVGRNMGYRKSFFLKNGGFNSHYHIVGGDDDLFVNAFSSSKNVMCRIGKEALVHSVPHDSWRAFFIQKIRHLSVGKHYKLADKIILGLFVTSMLLCWLLLIPSLVHSSFPYAIAGLFLFRLALFTGLVHTSSCKLGEPFEMWKTPFLDFVYVCYYFVMSVVVLKTKEVRWESS